MLKPIHNNNKGLAFILLVAAAGFVIIVVIGIVFLVQQRLRQGVYNDREAKAFYLAEAAMNDAWWELKASLEVNGNDIVAIY